MALLNMHTNIICKKNGIVLIYAGHRSIFNGFSISILLILKDTRALEIPIVHGIGKSQVEQKCNPGAQYVQLFILRCGFEFMLSSLFYIER